MAINKPIIDAGPTDTRKDEKISCVYITSAVPPADRTHIVGGVVTTTPQPPAREGQMLAYKTTAGVDLYVVANVGGTLTWKPVRLGTGYQSMATGQPWSSI